MKSVGWYTIFLSVIFLSLNKVKSAQDIIIDDELAKLIVEQLHNGTNVTLSTQSGTNSSPSNLNVFKQDGAGDITVLSDIRVPASSNFAKLSLIAERDIIVSHSDSADSFRIQNLQTGSSNGGSVFSFEAKGDIDIEGIIENFGPDVKYFKVCLRSAKDTSLAIYKPSIW